MEELELARRKVVELFGKVDDLDDRVVRAERMYKGKCYAVAYFDLADDVVGRANTLQDFQERILGDDFFGTPGDLRWNKYLYFVAGPKSRSANGFEEAKYAIESDKEYARKRVVTEEELEALLGVVKHFTPGTANKDYNVVAEWEKRLSAAGLDELLDKPPRKDVVERIGKKAVKRTPVADKSLTLLDADKSLAVNWLASISIDKFRPVHDGQSYTFGQVTLIVGPNGTGKTSLLEAIEYFYCGYNRRPGTASSPNISGTLVGRTTPLPAPTDAGRIRARCVSWYNRNEQRSNRILDAFTRFNFLDTDAAFRLATESDAEASRIPADLGRLLVGSDASGIWEYLSKLAPEVDTALERTALRADDTLVKLESAQKELKDVLSRPSDSKALAEAFRAALESLRWEAPLSTSPLPTSDEIVKLQEGIGHLQAVLSAGAGATSLKAISARHSELNAVLENAKPIETARIESSRAAKHHAVVAFRDEQGARLFDRWLTYLNGGYSTTHARLISAKTSADNALGKLGRYSSIEIPEIPEEYSATPLSAVFRQANLNVQNATVQVANLERQAANFGKMAAARAEAARQLQKAAQATLYAGHPADDCPICRAKYPPQELAALIDRITASLEQSNELTAISENLVNARKDLEYVQGWATFFSFLVRVSETISLSADAVCSDVPKRLIELKSSLSKANLELDIANKDWEQLANSGFSANEHDLLLTAVTNLLNSAESAYDRSTIEDSKRERLMAAVASRRLEAEGLEQQTKVTRQIDQIVATTFSDAWTTRATRSDGFQSLHIMCDEAVAIQSRVQALLKLIDIEEDQSLTELSNGLLGAARLYAEAVDAAKLESTASQTIRTLNERINSLTTQSNMAADQVKNYRSATETLSSLLEECSIEHATKESLGAISAQTNEIFSRIHAPNEYEYVGDGGVLLRTTATKQIRNLEQVSTGQRAAFALSVFLAMNRNATTAPPVILIDDPIAHIDDLNALSFLDYLRDLAVNSSRQIFFATADTKIAALFSRKFGFLGESFKRIPLPRESTVDQFVN
jgi:DNA repair protein SbcC/Rad50